MKYVIKFTKRDRSAFISHLDLQRLMLRALRIAGVKVAYSEGFNPHPKLSIALPLSLGFTSACEFLEFETHAPVDAQAAMSAMNKVLPEGVDILSFMDKFDNSGSLASRAKFVSYDIVMDVNARTKDEGANTVLTGLPECQRNLRVSTEDFLKQNVIIIEKHNRKTEKTEQRDIRPQIKDFCVAYAFNNRILFRCTLDARSGLNPSTLISAYCAFCAAAYSPEKTEVLRTEIVFS